MSGRERIRPVSAAHAIQASGPTNEPVVVEEVFVQRQRDQDAGEDRDEQRLHQSGACEQGTSPSSPSYARTEYARSARP